MNKEKLKPCPFCGANEKHLTKIYTTSGAQIHCGVCSARGPISEHAESAWNAWVNKSIGKGIEAILPVDDLMSDQIEFPEPGM